MRTLIQDLRFGFRMLAGNPGFAVTAVLTLALGIASTSTVFTWIDSVLLHPYPGASHPEQLAVVEVVSANAPNGGNNLSWLDYRDYRENLKLLAGIAIQHQGAFTLGEGTRAQLAWGEMVSGNYFEVLGIQAIRGRVFTPEENGDSLGAHPVVVISERLWRRSFHSDPALVGKAVRINRRELTVVGIVADEFRGTSPAMVYDLWIPATMGRDLAVFGDSTFTSRGNRKFSAIARLAPGVRVEQARAEAATAAARFAAAYPRTNTKVSATVLPVWGAHNGVNDYLLAPLRILMVVSFLVLLIVCANVANLLLARSVGRQKEFGIRLALGSGKLRLARQLLTETLILAVAGAVVSIPLLLWMASSLPALVPSVGLPVGQGYGLNASVFAFTALVCVVAALVSSLAPMLFCMRPDLNEALKEGGRAGSPSAASNRARGLLVVAEVALAVVALVGAGLFVRSFHNARAIHPGFDASQVLLGRFFIETTGYSPEQVLQFADRMRGRLEASPVVRGVSYSDFVPLSTTAGPYQPVEIKGYAPADGEAMTVNRALVSPGFFESLGMPLAEGRAFTEHDSDPAQPVMIVNESFARRYFHGASPVGRDVRCLGKWVRVVGMAKDAKYFSPAEPPRPFFFLPLRQYYGGSAELYLFVRASGDPEQVIPTLRRAVTDVAPDAAAFHPVALAEYTEVALLGQKVAAGLMAALGLMCLLLAALGLYSVMAYSVNQRTQEIGIRMAMGARSADVIVLVVWQGMALALVGLVLGSAVAFAITRLVSSMLIRVDATDPIAFIGAALFLSAVSAVAAWVPAMRATRIDPMIALRQQ